ncbi:MAG: biotin/lipoyl-containing protein [Thermotogota bacterium]|nr:biotin/lipoyl-containing protein [Thermotogota bacterium]
MVKKYNIKVNGKSYEVEVEEIGSENKHETLPNNNTQSTQQAKKPINPEPKTEVSNSNSSQSNIDAPMSGLVIDLKVKKGDSVNPGDKLLVLEAMKMENDIVSDITGIIDEIHCKKGDNVETGETLITIS